MSRWPRALAIALALASLSGCTYGDTRDTSTTSAPDASSGTSDSPSLRVEATDLLHDAEVSITGSGFEAGSDIVIAECQLGAEVGALMPDVCDMSGFVPLRAGADGEIKGTITVRTVIGTGKRLETVCLPDHCGIGAGYAEPMTMASIAPISWSSDATVAAAPVLTIQRLDLDPEGNSGTAVLRGEGFVPSSIVNLAQCPIATIGRGVDAEDCLYEYGTVAEADFNGELAVEMSVYPLFQRSSGEYVDCMVDPALCAIADPWPKDPANRMSIVSFDAAEN